MPERALCLKCHEKTTKSLATASHIHKPLEADCSSCHTAHGSSETALLRERPAVLCTSCHQDVAQQMALQTHDVHGALAGEGSCLHCHTPHVGTTPQLIKTPLSEGCFQCHGKELRLPSGTISNVAATIQARKFKHGPVGTGDCAACHESHASVHGHLLKGEFSESFYEPFSEGKFALCFGCHDKALVTEERTTRTAFRDGDRNLHHVHVHREKGRTCGVCHEPHASDSPALMRQSIPFGTGGWELPIRFARTETGGTCASGCHQELSYDNGRRPQQAGSPSPGAAPTPTGKDEETEKE